MYLALLGVLLAAWVFRITAFTPPRLAWLEAAGIAYIPGMAVVTIISAFYVVLVGIAFWPRERHAKGEFREGDHDKWKQTDQ